MAFLGVIDAEFVHILMNIRSETAFLRVELGLINISDNHAIDRSRTREQTSAAMWAIINDTPMRHHFILLPTLMVVISIFRRRQYWNPKCTISRPRTPSMMYDTQQKYCYNTQTYAYASIDVGHTPSDCSCRRKFHKPLQIIGYHHSAWSCQRQTWTLLKST